MNILLFGNHTEFIENCYDRIYLEFLEQGHNIVLVNNEETLFKDKIQEEEGLQIILFPFRGYEYETLNKMIKMPIDVCLGLDETVCSYVAEWKQKKKTKSYCIFKHYPFDFVSGEKKELYNFKYSEKYFYWLNCSLELDGIFFNNCHHAEQYYRQYKRESYVVKPYIMIDSWPSRKKEEYIVSCHPIDTSTNVMDMFGVILDKSYDYKYLYKMPNVSIEKYWINSKGRISLIFGADEIQKKEIFNRAKMLIHPKTNRWVNSIVPIEAISVGTPCVLFDHPIFREWFEDCCLYAKDIKDFSKKIKLLYKDKDLYNDLSLRSRFKFVDFLKEFTVKKFISIFEEK